jgi:hypothetical protein
VRRTIITFVLVLAGAVGLGAVAVATSGGSIITAPRLARSVTTAFVNVYTQQARILGHKGVTPASLRPQAMCDRGYGVPQSGPGTTWNCLVSWQDPNMPMPSTGYGKIEVTVHTNGCYTASPSSSLVGYQTITAADGTTVTNPAYEFDGCIDPDSSNAPTGVVFASELKMTNTSANVASNGSVGADLLCNVGASGCRGTLSATADGRSLGSVPFDLHEQETAHVTLPRLVPAGAKDVSYTFTGKVGILPSPTDLPVQR